MSTKVEESEFKGNKTFQVWDVDDEGEKTGQYPVVSMGKRKLKAILNHVEEAKKFVEEN